MGAAAAQRRALRRAPLASRGLTKAMSLRAIALEVDGKEESITAPDVLPAPDVLHVRCRRRRRRPGVAGSGNTRAEARRRVCVVDRGVITAPPPESLCPSPTEQGGDRYGRMESDA